MGFNSGFKGLRISGVIPLLPQCVFMVWVGTDVLFTQQEFVHLRKYFRIVLVYLPCYPKRRSSHSVYFKDAI